MTKRGYFILSLLLIVCAVSSQVAKMRYVGSAHTLYHFKFMTMSAVEKAEAKVLADASLQKAKIVWYFGIAFAIPSFILWIASRVPKAPLWHLIPFILLLFYLGLQLVII